MRAAAAAQAGHEMRRIELWDPGSLGALIDGAAVLVNCLGPAYRTRGRIVSAALARGVPYLDPNGDDAMHERISESVRQEPAQVAMLTGVGSVPGVFGLLARWLAAGMPGPVQSISGYVVTIEPIHAGTAAEFLLGLLDRRATDAAWYGGRRTAAPGRTRTAIRLPYVAGPLDAHPYLTLELETVAADLGLRDAVFYHTFESGSAILRHLESIAGRGLSGGTIRELAGELAATVNRDMEQRAPLHMLAVEARSDSGLRSAIMRSASSYQLTASLAVLAAREIIMERIRPGLSRADVLAPALVTELPGIDDHTHLDVRDGGLDDWGRTPPSEP
jgi:short subunit dehydrogenase-like uncharacterized protein